MEKKELFSTKDLVLIALFVSVISVCSFIRIPFGIVPFTLQTVGVFSAAGILGMLRGSAVILVYILIGLVGIPVFGGNAGPIALIGPTGGYIVGFLLAPIIIGGCYRLAIAKKIYTRRIMITVGMLLAEVVCMTVGTVHYMNVTQMELRMALATCVIPFLIPDIIKIVFSIIIVEAVRKNVANNA